MIESLWIWVLVASLLSLILYIITTWSYDHFSKRNVPSLKTVPFFGNMWPTAAKKVAFCDHVVDLYKGLRGHKYGGVYQFMRPLIMLRDPELIKMVTVKDFEFFLDHMSAFSEDVEPLFGKSLINLTGLRWKDMRSTLSPAFTSSKMKMMFKLITDCGDQMGEFLQKCIKDKKNTPEGCNMEREGDMLTVEMKDLFTRYTNDVIATSAFGIGCDSFNHPKNEFYEKGKEATTFTAIRTLIFFGFLMSPTLMKVLRVKFFSNALTNYFRSMVTNTIKTREQKGILRPDMIHLLMQAKKGTLKDDVSGTDNNMTNKLKLEDDDLTAQALLFLFGGFETTSVLLCFVAHELAVHPDIQAKLQDEIDDQLNNDGGKLTYEAVHSMKYLDMVLSEALRKYPPAAITDRRCIKRYTLPSDPPYTLEPGDGLWIPIYAIHRDPENFPNPEKFDPERFSEENKDNIKPYTYLPFGSGPRNCIGNRFALMESKIALVHLLSRFNLKVVSKTPIPIKLSKKKINLTVDGGFWLGIEERVKH